LLSAELKDGNVVIRLENPVKGSTDKKQTLVLTIPKDEYHDDMLKSVTGAIGDTASKVVEESSLLKEIRTAVAKTLKPTVAISVPAAKTPFTSVAELVEDRGGKLNTSFAKSKNKDIDPSKLSLLDVHVVGLENQLSLPEGATVETTRIKNNDKKNPKDVTLATITLENGTKRYIILNTTNEEKITKVIGNINPNQKIEEDEN
jgi:hypothetical protein